jgi:UDP-N-acetylmuramate-alanine ligase
MQQQHNKTTTTAAMIRVVLDLLGSSGAGVIGGVSMFSSKQ